MKLDLALLERLLITLFDLSESQRPALLGRFKYLQRLGAPSPQVGEGRARYALEDVLRIVVIFELIDAGCAPARSIRVVRTHWDQLRGDLAEAWQTLAALRKGAGVERLAWTVVPHALQELGAGESMVDVAVDDRAGLLDPKAVLEWPLERALQGDRHAIFVDLVRLVSALEAAVERVGPSHSWSFAKEMDKFSKLPTKRQLRF